MNKKNSKRKLLLVLAFLVSMFSYYVYVYIEKIEKPEGSKEIFEIKNTREVYNYRDSRVDTIML